MLFSIGRGILGLWFLYSGYVHFANSKGLTGYAAAKGLPAPALSVVGSGLLLALGGLSILTGYLVVYAAYLLAAFVVLAALLFHNFWTVTDPAQQMVEKTQFLKNLAVGAALLMLSTIQTWTW